MKDEKTTKTEDDRERAVGDTSGGRGGPIVSSCRDIILDSLTEGVFTVDREWRITSFNRAAEEITGVPRRDALGRPCRTVLCADVCERGCPLERTIRTGEPIQGKMVTIVDRKGRRRPIGISTAVLKDDGGRVLGGVEIFRDLSQIQALKRELERRVRFEDIVSRNHAMQALFDILPQVADSTATVLITGESGTGKELFARAIHNLSPRRDGPFIAVNCGALPDTLLESELFGHHAGAFTDARRKRLGRIAAAERGTLFLDEIGDISPALQVRLLRFLQERVYEPLGADRPVRADVRVVAATNRDLDALVAAGDFRRDLYYRINVVSLVIPPLRDRMEDLPLLVEHFIARFNALQGRSIEGVDNDAMACLMAHDWPGNVRELENVLERAFIFCKEGLIGLRHLPDFLRTEPGAGDLSGPGGREGLRRLEAAYIRKCLESNGWNKTETARSLGMHKTTLYRKMKALGIVDEKPGGRRGR